MTDRDNLKRIRAVALDSPSPLLQRRGGSSRDHATGERKYNRRSKLMDDSVDEVAPLYPMVRFFSVLFICACLLARANEAAFR